MYTGLAYTGFNPVYMVNLFSPLYLNKYLKRLKVEQPLEFQVLFQGTVDPIQA